ncbi:unnamed protein product, partial [Rotaria sp. Silwood1]
MADLLEQTMPELPVE